MLIIQISRCGWMSQKAVMGITGRRAEDQATPRGPVGVRVHRLARPEGAARRFCQINGNRRAEGIAVGAPRRCRAVLHGNSKRKALSSVNCRPQLDLLNHTLFPARVLRKGTFLSILFSGPLPRQSLFHSSPFARLQVVRVTFHLFNDVFRLNLTFKSSERIL